RDGLSPLGRTPSGTPSGCWKWRRKPISPRSDMQGRACHDAVRRRTMRYMMLIYTKERESGLTREQAEQLTAAHRAVMQETTRKGILRGRAAGSHHHCDHRPSTKRQSADHGRTVR